MNKQWKAEKQFTLDCPICREPALPQQVETPYGKKGWALIHPGRIATCFVKEGTDAAESIRMDFNGAFGRTYTDASPQDVTDEISTLLTIWSKTSFGRVDSDQYKAIETWIRGGTPEEINRWGSEGGANAD